MTSENQHEEDEFEKAQETSGFRPPEDEKDAEKEVTKTEAPEEVQVSQAPVEKDAVADAEVSDEEREAAVKKVLAKQAAARAIAQSWRVLETAQKRATMHSVFVNGTEYRSVRAAFRVLGIDDKGHEKFRVKLKAEGKATYEGYEFTLGAENVRTIHLFNEDGTPKDPDMVPVPKVKKEHGERKPRKDKGQKRAKAEAAEASTGE